MSVARAEQRKKSELKTLFLFLLHPWMLGCAVNPLTKINYNIKPRGKRLNRASNIAAQARAGAQGAREFYDSI
jgi:hypothetical protein